MRGIMLRWIVSGTNRALLSLAAIGCVVQFTFAQAETPAPARQEELIQLLRNDCGACHGLRLSGGLGPALRPEALRDKAADSLKQVILQGRPGTPMPGWAPFISDSEAEWLVELLVHGIIDEPGVIDETGVPDEN